jgi:hypothetical protein
MAAWLIKGPAELLSKASLAISSQYIYQVRKTNDHRTVIQIAFASVIIFSSKHRGRVYIIHLCVECRPDPFILSGSVWACPVCAGKISERRREELKLSLDIVHRFGGSAQLWTFTAPHHVGQSLEFLLIAMNKARRKMLNRKSWKRLIPSLDVIGTIRSLEVTFSLHNGWHVHFHVLTFLSGTHDKFELMDIEEEIYAMWRSACLDSGLSEPSRAHGVSVEDGSKAAAYVGKWGLEHEMTKSHIKQGREGHFTPFDFLRQYLAGNPCFGPVFKEYAREFRGKRQLVWSDGLRDQLCLGKEQSDKELVDGVEEAAAFFARIPLSVWRVILRHELRGEVLEVCRQGKQALVDYIFQLTGENISINEPGQRGILDVPADDVPY